MTKRKKTVVAVCVLLAVAVIAGFTTLAVTTFGTESDPLVTLSYLDTTVTPALEAKLNTILPDAETKFKSELDSMIADYTSEIESKLGNSSAESAEFVLVTLSNGQVLTCSVGTEIMLRVGTAASYGNDSPRLIDTSTATAVTAAGTALVKNHMYMVTIQGNGIKATSATVKLLVRGSYTVG